ncbi:acyl-CoA dehydrogenase family protein [Deinococcus peraridilitoris]|uniref:Acyl-CoA dehydrogenase n=1 Tax=Deinococcus peraridilitoris (strain DSM 19664 / LMG 22246 / CIP 109416 / KR-200) TaxID=937777 RepID=L0A5T8_DEIPD|nr:acyl-CoA dehydrogenase family protein [Deinococcus peraridilitoris]AFZ68809.1 acyl-CoA dehydrogenase [Deinococcus peraridilitoris DSM 19664]
MTYDPTPDQRVILDALKSFLRNRVAPGAAERDQTGEFPLELTRELGELGVMGAQTPEEYGGAGLDTATFAMIIEEIAAVDGSLCLTVASHNSLCQGHILIAGTEEQKRRFLPDLASARKLGAWGLTEPGSGSDSGGLGTRAVLQDDGSWILNGSKNFITQGSVGGTYVILARTDAPRPGRSKNDGISAFVFNRDEVQGFSIGRTEDKLGLRSSDTAQLIFEDVRLDAGALLGQRGGAFKDVMRVLDGGRIGIGAMGLGLGRAAFEFAARYAVEREQFGQPIAHNQGIGFKLADMDTQLEAARLLLRKAADLKDQGRDFTVSAARAKLFASEVGVKACDEAIQILGGYGYIKEYPVERFWRDNRLTRIGEGTSEVQRLIISRHIIGRYAQQNVTA